MNHLLKGTIIKMFDQIRKVQDKATKKLKQTRSDLQLMKY